MTGDIVDRLRESIAWLNRAGYEARDQKDALAEILRLRAILEALPDALSDAIHLGVRQK